jgi:BirA family biotin operon repressor/biotin-[acetyl-CoA-carboxylase] ligase
MKAVIKSGLTTKTMGREIFHYHSLESTNNTARQLAEDGAEHGTLVIAARQTAGRGRGGRRWSSPEGGIWLSLILRPQLLFVQASLITLLTAVAAAETTREVCCFMPDIKWPNDLLAGGKKLAGVLTEAFAVNGGIHYLVVGLGININIRKNDFPPELRQQATSILIETGKQTDRALWVRSFLMAFEQLYDEAAADGFAAVLDRWRRYSSTLGKDVLVCSSGCRIRGKALDIDGQGALLVETEGSIRRFWAGEVIFEQER